MVSKTLKSLLSSTKPSMMNFLGGSSSFYSPAISLKKKTTLLLSYASQSQFQHFFMSQIQGATSRSSSLSPSTTPWAQLCSISIAALLIFAASSSLWSYGWISSVSSSRCHVIPGWSPSSNDVPGAVRGSPSRIASVSSVSSSVAAIAWAKVLLLKGLQNHYDFLTHRLDQRSSDWRDKLYFEMGVTITNKQWCPGALVTISKTLKGFSKESFPVSGHRCPGGHFGWAAGSSMTSRCSGYSSSVWLLTCSRAARFSLFQTTKPVTLSPRKTVILSSEALRPGRGLVSLWVKLCQASVFRTGSFHPCWIFTLGSDFPSQSAYLEFPIILQLPSYQHSQNLCSLSHYMMNNNSWII